AMVDLVAKLLDRLVARPRKRVLRIHVSDSAPLVLALDARCEPTHVRVGAGDRAALAEQLELAALRPLHGVRNVACRADRELRQRALLMLEIGGLREPLGSRRLLDASDVALLIGLQCETLEITRVVPDAKQLALRAVP